MLHDMLRSQALDLNTPDFWKVQLLYELSDYSLSKENGFCSNLPA